MAENFKTDFFTDRIGRGIQDIFQAQLDIATKRIYQKGRERRKVQGTGGDHTRAIRCINGRTTEPELFGHSGRRRSNRTF